RPQLEHRHQTPRDDRRTRIVEITCQDRKRLAPLAPALPCSVARRSGRVFVEAFMARGPVVCVHCDKGEPFCNCEKYCIICKCQDDVHLCVDGLYYCPDCREACDLALADSRAR